MKTFKFLSNSNSNFESRELEMRWVDVAIHRYTFRIRTIRPDILINEELQYIRRNFMTLFDEDLDRENLLRSLRLRFPVAINVISHDELVRNNNYV